MYSFRFSGPARDCYELAPRPPNGAPARDAVEPSLAAAVLMFCADELLAHPEFRTCAQAWGLPGPDARLVRHLADELGRGCAGAFKLRWLDARPAVSPTRDIDPTWLTELDPEPEVVKTTWFELTVLDELGEPLPGIEWRIRAGNQWHLSTDDAGQVRAEDAETSFGTADVADRAALRDALEARWSSPRGREWAQPPSGETTIVGLTSTSPVVALTSETPHTVIFQPRVARARIVGAAFDTNKSFVRPEALPRLQSVVDLYGAHDGAELLIVGHTDTSGQPDYNDALSLSRAESVAAYLKDDVDAWLAQYDSSVSSSQRWGDLEDWLMLDHVLFQTGTVSDGDPVADFQAAFGLDVDGDLGPLTRRELVTQYMALDGTTLPASITPVPHGCGESFPLADDGETLDVTPPDGQDDPTDRRVELFFFDAPLPVLPPPPGEISPAGGAEYLEWRLRSRQTDDFLVTTTRALAVRVTDERTGEVLPGARVQLEVAALEGAGLESSGGVMTNAFGVAAFMALDIGTYHLRVDKDGFSESLGTHTLAESDPPKVIPVALEPRAFVHLRPQLADPEGKPVALPEGTKVIAEHEDGQTFEAATDADGVVAFKVDRHDGRLSFRLDLGAACYLVAPTNGDAPSWAAEADAVQATATRARFVRVPPEQSLDAHLSTLSGVVAFEDDRFVALPDAATKTSPDAPLELTLAPRWQCLQFEFHDRFTGKRATVPALLGEDAPAPVLSGHLTISKTAAVPAAAAHSVWPVERSGQHTLCLAWFPDAARPLPDGASMVRLTTPPSTFVVSAHDGEARALEEVPSSGPRFDLVNEPSATRLRFYDLPADWRSEGYWVRLAGDPKALKQRYVDRATEATTPAKPLVVSLDDIVLAHSDGKGGAVVVDPADTDEYSILDQNLQVYKANEVAAGGYGEPYFTDQRELTPTSKTDKTLPTSLILDHPEFTRAVVYEQIHEVFDRRMTATDNGDAPIGARLALSHFASADTVKEAEAEEKAQQDAAKKGKQVKGPSNHYFQSFYYGEPHALERNPDGLTWKTFFIGRSSLAVFRCCGHEDSGGVEKFAVLRHLRLNADFSPTADPPGGAKRLGDGDYKVPTADQQQRIVAQALATAAHCWNGTDKQDKVKVINSLDLDAAAKLPLDTSTDAPTFEIAPAKGGPVTARGSHVVLFTRGLRPESTRTNIKVNVFENVRASMPFGRSEAEWDLGDFRPINERAEDKPEDQTEADRRHFTFAHELGHALGLNDEYLERSHHASLRAPSISDRGIMPGGPYEFDDGEKDVLGSMMKSANVPRNRHFWSVIPWLVHVAGMFDGSEGTVVRGTHRYSLPVTRPEESPHMFPVAATPSPEGAKIRNKGLCDVFLYRMGDDVYSAERLAGKAGPYDALIVARLKLALTFDGYGFAEAQSISKRIAKDIESMFSATQSRFAEIELDGVKRRARILVSPRVIVRNLPVPIDDDEVVKLDRYLAKLAYRRIDLTDVSVPSAALRLKLRPDIERPAAEIAAEKAKLEAEIKAEKATEEADLAAKQAKFDQADADFKAADAALQQAKADRDSGAIPKAQADAAVKKADGDRFNKLIARDTAKHGLNAAKKALLQSDAADRLHEIENAQKLFDEAGEKLEAEYKAFVDAMIEDQHVHANVKIQRKGVSRITDKKSVPREVIARFGFDAEKRIKILDAEAMTRIGGRLLGLLTPGFFPPPSELTPLCEALEPVKGTLAIKKVRRHK
ncbi:MAG: carboxypeptidase regulatory-like domain-containing protein [Myxococcota bacterium]